MVYGSTNDTMCGIAGVLSAGAASDLGHAVLLMQRALAHRGPDDHGAWTSPHGEATFAHTRLAIIDPTPAGRQPMSIDHGRLTVTLNGEIYNFMELRHELEGRGVAFQSRTDTEVVLRAYDAYGDACVERFRGMFAFALWDERARRGLLARDRFGIKPLYYSIADRRLVFASEVRALLASGLVPRAIDGIAAYQYFRTGSVPEPRTLAAGVSCLEAGQFAVWQDRALKRTHYFDIAFDAAPPSGDPAAATRAALADSVAHHFVSDVPVGIFLSGGVDSTALLALAVASGRQDVRALTMALPGSPDDELALARRTAQHLGVPHDVCEVDAVSARRLFDDYRRVMDQPSIDGMNTLAVSQLAAACGLKVMLSGLGADELFGGYPSVSAVPRLAALHTAAVALGPIRAMAARSLVQLGGPRSRRIGDMLEQQPGLSSAYAAYRGIFTRAEARALTRQFGCETDGEPPAPAAPDDPTPSDAVCRLEMTRYLRNQLLRDTDVMSMACGVEVRVPFIDEQVVRTVTSIPPRERLGAQKALLRRAVPEIPAWISTQPKRGFMFPIEQWLGGEWGGVFDATDARCVVPTQKWYRQWCVHAFEAWVERLHEVPVAAEPCLSVPVTRGANG